MIAKQYRLSENEVKKVLQKWKPFFSYWIVLNYLKNKDTKNRFAIVISGKSVAGSVARNYFRRRFYDMCISRFSFEGQNNFFDLVFVVKKDTLLSEKNQKMIEWFLKEVQFLFEKLEKNYER